MNRFLCGFQEVKFAEGDATTAGKFSGYGAVFGNEDFYGDVIEKGAFKGTLREWKKRGKWPKMLCQHGGWGMNAGDLLPIGSYTKMEEDEKGLFCEGQLFCLDTERGKYIHAGLKSGDLDGLSIGYTPIVFEMGNKPNEPRRRLKEIDLAEVSIVTFPANGKALIGDVKSGDDPNFKRHLERFLRDVGGMSKAEAKAFVAEGFGAVARRDAGAASAFEGLSTGLQGLRKAAHP